MKLIIGEKGQKDHFCVKHRDMYNLDVDLAKVLAITLRMFHNEVSEGVAGIPASYFPPDGVYKTENDEEAKAAWLKDLTTMAQAFEWYASGQQFDCEDTVRDNPKQAMEPALELFKQSFTYLWT